MKNKIAVFTCLIIITLFFTYKPLYAVLLFTLFSYEHFLFFNFVISFLKAKRSDSYACFNVTPLKTTNICTYKIWLKINEIYAYRRLYTMVAAKKLSWQSILFATIIIFLGFPVKVFKLIKFLMQHNANLHESLTYLYFLNYDTINGKKIEVIFKKTYLNPLTRSDIIKKITQLNPRKSLEEIAQIYSNLVQANNSFMRNNKLNENMAPFMLGHLKTEEGFKIKIPHWTNASHWKVNGEKILCAVHATSNMPEKLTNSQLKSVAIQELVKATSNRPASVITHGGYTFRPVKNEQKFVKSWQLHYVMYDVYKADLSSPYINEFIERDDKIINILGPAASNADINEFSACIHNEILENDYGKDYNKIHSELLKEISDITR